MEKISLYDAASQLEQICDQIDSSDEVSTSLQTVFQDGLSNLATSIDRRISFIHYLEDAIDSSKAMADKWNRRKKILAKILGRIEDHTKMIMLQTPDLPFRGNMGELRIRTAGVAKMILSGVLEDIDGKFIDENDESLLQDLKQYHKFLKPGFKLDNGLLKKSLESGEEYECAKLEFTSSVKVKI